MTLSSSPTWSVEVTKQNKEVGCASKQIPNLPEVQEMQSIKPPWEEDRSGGGLLPVVRARAKPKQGKPSSSDMRWGPMDQGGGSGTVFPFRSTDFRQACQVSPMGQGTVISRNDNGKTGYPPANRSRPHPSSAWRYQPTPSDQKV